MPHTYIAGNDRKGEALEDMPNKTIDEGLGAKHGSGSKDQSQPLVACAYVSDYTYGLHLSTCLLHQLHHANISMSEGLGGTSTPIG